MEETVTIKKTEYDELMRRDFYLGFLEACGVDNWDPGMSLDEYCKDNKIELPEYYQD